MRTQHDRYERQASLGETRVQLDWEKALQDVTLKLTADLLVDAVLDRHSVDLQTGRGLLDLRQANVTFSPIELMDVKVGRQILTWGTGDLIFINDLFPKDWQSFFVGRDVEYLKAPSDAAKISLFMDWANLDIAYTPDMPLDESCYREAGTADIFVLIIKLRRVLSCPCCAFFSASAARAAARLSRWSLHSRF